MGGGGDANQRIWIGKVTFTDDLIVLPVTSEIFQYDLVFKE